eukprot:m.119475 g.119475  ORF g.119475 m.119475 type:complete len:328 (-) comp17239_c0_seq1:250-1233(-)
MALVTIADVAQFDAAVEQSPLLAAHFWASWAPQCNQIDDVLSELLKMHPGVSVIRVEAEKFVEVSQKYGIVAVPTVLMYREGKLVDRVDGANAPLLTKMVGDLAASAPRPTQVSSSGTSATSNKTDINDRLKELINAAPVMLFMKGTPAEPKCGFSRKIVAVLNEHRVEFSYFNILVDDDVRQGLKTYSDWPTFPQLYIAGDLVGGLDIVNEMAASGDLQAAIPKKEDLNKRLEKLINREKVMVFIKGTRDAPRCGFSRTILGLLNDEGVKFGYYDILGDEEVRAGLKKYSDWPTYPQLYANGELLGGLDIVKEMQASGELKKALTE